MKQPAELLTFKWIRFEDITPDDPKRKTRVYAIINKEYNGQIGTVSWYRGFRKYAFYPADNTVYETTCLGDIITFINQLMLDHRVARDQEKNNKLSMLAATGGPMTEVIKTILEDDEKFKCDVCGCTEEPENMGTHHECVRCGTII